MKKYTRLISMFSLILAITLLFSGCGVIDFAKSLLNKNETTEAVSNNYETTSEVIYNNEYVTEGAVITPVDNTSATTTAAASSSVSSSNKNNSSNKTPTSSASSSSSSASSSSSSTSTTSAKKTTTTEAATTQADLSNLSVKTLQDMLFATEDPNTAGQILNACGFEYDSEQCIYYSRIDPLQRYFGYNYIYDMMAPQVGMYYSTERILFEYDNKDWMIQLWKGQYGITAGAEIGLYNKTDKIMHYDCASDDELITMAFDFYNQGEYVFSRGPEEHWWLTGFKVFHVGVGFLIDLDITLTFPTVEMANAFEKGLKSTAATALLDPITYSRSSKTFKIHW